MSFDQGGDAGTTAATDAALIQIAKGQSRAIIEQLENAPPGPIETKWGRRFRRYSECLEYIRSNNIQAPEGGIAVPLRYTIHEQPSYSIVSSNAIWRDPMRENDAKVLRRDEQDNNRLSLYFLQILRDARRIESNRIESKNITQVFPPIAPSAWTSLASHWPIASLNVETSMTRTRSSACYTLR